MANPRIAGVCVFWYKQNGNKEAFDDNQSERSDPE